MTTLNFETISFQLDHHIATVRLNRPGKANAMNAAMLNSTPDAFFTIKEIDLGMTADVGTLQRLPQMVGEGMARELAYTGRTRSMPKRPDRSV